MVGLPFPNIFSGELIVKRKHLAAKIMKSGGTEEEASRATKEFMENICMKAVNQSVGRAIRHANDYANIYLLDVRYNRPNFRKKLSRWVQDSINSNIQHIRSFLQHGSFFNAQPEFTLKGIRLRVYCDYYYIL